MDNNYSTYIDELINFVAVVRNFRQITCDTYDLPSEYTSYSSLLFTADAGEFIEFINSEPVNFIKYEFLLNIGSMRDPKFPVGLISASESEPEFDVSLCNIYADYFRNMPTKQISINVLITLMYKAVEIQKIPQNSVLRINKKVRPIDFDNPDDINMISDFLRNERKLINMLQKSIFDADEQIKQVVKFMTERKQLNERKLNSILLNRGGSIESHEILLNRFSKIDSV
jgi:hypothetical protein